VLDDADVDFCSQVDGNRPDDEYRQAWGESNKNGIVDAETIAAAVERKNMCFAPIKTGARLDLHVVHRVRDRLISRLTAVINQLRAFLLRVTLIAEPAVAQGED